MLGLSEDVKGAHVTYQARAMYAHGHTVAHGLPASVCEAKEMLCWPNMGIPQASGNPANQERQHRCWCAASRITTGTCSLRAQPVQASWPCVAAHWQAFPPSPCPPHAFIHHNRRDHIHCCAGGLLQLYFMALSPPPTHGMHTVHTATSLHKTTDSPQMPAS